MRRLTLILIITGAVLAVAQAAVAQFVSVPITVISQTLRVDGTGGTTGDVVGGSSVATSWSLSDEHGSSGGTVSSVLTDGEIIFTIDGALSKGSTAAEAVVAFISLILSFELTVPDLGDATTPLYFQVARTNGVHTGTAEPQDLDAGFPSTSYTSQLFGSPVQISFVEPVALPPGDTLLTISPFDLIPTDTVTLGWGSESQLRVSVDNSTGTFSDTYTFRAITLTPAPEPSASLAIPSGIGMLYVLSKLRGVELVQ